MSAFVLLTQHNVYTILHAPFRKFDNLTVLYNDSQLSLLFPYRFTPVLLAGSCTSMWTCMVSILPTEPLRALFLQHLSDQLSMRTQNSIRSLKYLLSSQLDLRPTKCSQRFSRDTVDTLFEACPTYCCRALFMVSVRDSVVERRYHVIELHWTCKHLP